MYGYGLLDMRREELYSLDAFEFLDIVEGKLLWEERELKIVAQQQDSQTDWIAWFTANIMQSSGNYKKNVDALKIKEGLYQTEAELAEQSKEVKERDAKAEKAKVMAVFDLSEDSLKTK